MFSSVLATLGCVLAIGACSADDSSGDSPVCGDAKYEHTAEQCDDGNLVSGDGCSDTCLREAGWNCAPGGPCSTTCGDQVVAGNEVCDHGPTSGQPYCLKDCSGESGSCGDGVIQAEQAATFSYEQCDTGAQAHPGCVECLRAFGYLCDGEPSQCGQTGLPPEKPMAELSGNDIVTFCAWLTGILGGEGNEIQCGSTIFTIYSPTACAGNMDLTAFGACTIAEVEQHAIAVGGACALLTTDPACVN